MSQRQTHKQSHNRGDCAMDIGITELRVAATLASLACFAGIWVWAWRARRRPDFDEAARLPFEQD